MNNTKHYVQETFLPYHEDQALCKTDGQPRDTYQEYKSQCRIFHAQVVQAAFHWVY